MYIRKIWIDNVRCFGTDAQRVDLDLARPDGRFAGWTVFAGRNGAGKSTLLKAIALAVVGLSNRGNLEESFAGWIRQGATQAYMGVELDVGLRDGFSGPGTVAGGREPFWADVEIVATPDGPEPLVQAYAHNERPKNRDRGPWAENPKGWFLAGYGPFRRLSGHSADAVRQMAGPARIARVVSLFREDASLAECVTWLRDVYTRRLENKPGAKELEESVLALLNDGLLPAGMRIDHIDSDGLWTERAGVQLPLRELSDGYRTVAALVLDLVKQLHACFGAFAVEWNGEVPTVPHSGVVLIDEADIHLHVSWQQRIGFWLKEHFPNVQFLVTTHSPFICQAADPKGLIRLPAPDTNERAEHVPDELFKTVVQGGADDAAMTGLFGLEHTHSEAAEELRRRVAKLEARALRDHATPEEEQELLRLRAELPQTGSIAIDQLLRNARAAE
jgi:energy-coupling factor transporter ATP-binding protein EcfA2